MKKTIVFFDTEGFLESPYRQEYDESAVLSGILKILDKHQVKAVFNVCGKVAEKNQKIIRKLHDEGHEIASHGYAHENFLQLSDGEIIEVIAKTNKIIKKITGKNPAGIRAPGLMANQRIYSVFRRCGFSWASHQYTLFPEMFQRPDYKHNLTAKLAYSMYKLKNISYRKSPYMTKGLLEIPLASSLETDLLSIVSMQQSSPDEWLDSAFKALVSQYKASGSYFNLNFHPWMIGSANRLLLLDRILGYLKNKKTRFVLARELL